MKFTFAPESRPLEGFTIKRAIYRGGFGEVYYALSDAGREVALKLLQNNAEIELRGIQQCLNLSHPNLVTIFDVRRDGEGDHWIVMEYVSGETLDAVIRKHPDGMPLETVRKWLPGIVAGVAYLHSRGLVHRDLKPANIFSEDAVVKIGDVGLSKFITPSRRSAQTQSVGTVYYMAPEVAKGKYGREVDVYAMGVILYEMLTGQVPFNGESTGEILMKHLSEPPDLSKLPPRLRGVIGKALEKDPEKRYRSMDRLRRAFEDAVLGRVEPVEIPDSSFLGDSLKSGDSPQGGPGWTECSAGSPGEQPNRAPRGFARDVAPTPATRPLTRRYLMAFLGAWGGALVALFLEHLLGAVGADWEHQTALLYVLGPGAGFAVGAVLAGSSEFGRRVRTVGDHRSPKAVNFGQGDHGSRPFMSEVTAQGGLWLVALAVVAAAMLIPVTILGIGVGMGVLVLGTFIVAVIAGLVVKWQDFVHWNARENAPPGRPRPMPTITRPGSSVRPGLGPLFGGAFLTVPLTALLTTGMAIVKPSLFTLSGAGQLDPAAIGLFSLVSVAACWAILATPYVAGLFGRGRIESRVSFATAGVLVGLLAFLANRYLLFTLSAPPLHGTDAMFRHIGELQLLDPATGPTWAGFMTFFAVLFSVRQWSKLTDPRRRVRFSVSSVLMTLFVAWVATLVFAFPTAWALAWASVIGCVVQLASPWDPTRTGTRAWG